eukprot:259771_1
MANLLGLVGSISSLLWHHSRVDIDAFNFTGCGTATELTASTAGGLEFWWSTDITDSKQWFKIGIPENIADYDVSGLLTTVTAPTGAPQPQEDFNFLDKCVGVHLVTFGDNTCDADDGTLHYTRKPKKGYFRIRHQVLHRVNDQLEQLDTECLYIYVDLSGCDNVDFDKGNVELGIRTQPGTRGWPKN